MLTFKVEIGGSENVIPLTQGTANAAHWHIRMTDLPPLQGGGFLPYIATDLMPLRGKGAPPMVQKT